MQSELAAQTSMPDVITFNSNREILKPKPPNPKQQVQPRTALNLTEALLTKRNEIFSLERLIDGNLSLESTLPMNK